MNKTKAVEAMKAIAIFKGREIRRILHRDEWWFFVVNVAGR